MGKHRPEISQHRKTAGGDISHCIVRDGLFIRNGPFQLISSIMPTRTVQVRWQRCGLAAMSNMALPPNRSGGI